MIHNLIREIHALAIRKLAACNNLTDSIRSLKFRYLKDNQSIVYKNTVSYLQVLDQVLVINSNSLLISDDVFRRQCKRSAFLQLDLTVLKCLDTVFRSLGIQHNRNWK